ncbi:MAG: ATP-binding cassette domain-containing protein [Bacteroidales bacterium]|nr:MAG: ATP-binding cassette domain-containing protein [Bacteroidales bacterium]
MNKTFLISLLRLFANITALHAEVVYGYSRSFIEKLLRNDFHLQDIEHYIKLLDDFYKEYLPKEKELPKDSDEQNLLKTICNSIISDLPIKERIIIVVHLLQFIKFYQINHFNGYKTDNRLRVTIDSIAANFCIKANEYHSLCEFVFENLHRINGKKNLIIVGKFNIFNDIKFIRRENLKGQIYFLYLPSVNMLMFYYNGDENIYLNNNQIFPLTIYSFSKSSVISAMNNIPIYYHEVIEYFLDKTINESIHLAVIDIEYRFKKGDNGIKRLSIHGESGELLGIMGASGTGKTTLMNILNGTIKPPNGSIRINGHSIYDEHINFQNIIGFVPQDDLLFEELTVYKNLYYNAKLCFGLSANAEIDDKVNSLLLNLDLYDIRHLKVGSPLDKYISGGQRKRLNIALELIREPAILLLDEPTSGLSSNDAENIIRLLGEQTHNGKLVIINIHQPSSNIFKQIDQLLILDVGGYPIYFGKAMEAINYFKRISEKINSTSYECEFCGNISPEDILNIIDEKKTNEQGKFLSQRKVEPKEWNQYYTENINIAEQTLPKHTTIPEVHFELASRLNQFKIFFKRQALSRLSDKQYLAMIILISPALALILGFFCKYAIGTIDNPKKYLFIENLNLPVYLFMSVISSLFVGMIISAEEIHRDRKIREREKFISLSRFSYINSKVSFLFAISAIQSFLFVLIGNSILQINGMNLTHGIILFSVSCCANLIGLNISSAFKSLVAIYILIPLMLVPQILLSGIIVPFDKLNYTMKSEKYVPIIGDIMLSRWAFEALAVSQFRDNDYQQHWFDIEQHKSNTSYIQLNLIPFLVNLIDDIETETLKGQIKLEDIKVLNNGLKLINSKIRNPFNYSLNEDDTSLLKLKEVNLFLSRCKSILSEQMDKFKEEENGVFDNLYLAFNRNDKAMLKFKQENYNNSIADYVLSNNEFKKLIIQDGEIVRKAEPIYDVPENSFGRAQFYAADKRIGSLLIDTVLFNSIVIWIMSLGLYIVLIADGLKVSIDALEKLR